MSSNKIYVGNLSWNTTDDTLREEFKRCGQVTDAIVMRDRDTGRSRGFGFVTYSSAEEAQTAINMFNETTLDGRNIKVNLANARAATNAPTQPSSYGGGFGPSSGSAPGGYSAGGYQTGTGYQQGYQGGNSGGGYGGYGQGPYQGQSGYGGGY